MDRLIHLVVSTLAFLLVLLGCHACTAKPDAASSNLTLTPLEQEMKLVLDDRDRAEIRAAFATLVAEHEPVTRPGPAEHGVRWSDVQLAAYYACMDVEMAVMRSHRSTVEGNEQLRFELRSAGETVGELIVQRVDNDRIYTATASIGLFADDDETAQRLLTAFDRRMRALGRKRAFNE